MVILVQITGKNLPKSENFYKTPLAVLNRRKKNIGPASFASNLSLGP